MRGTLAPFHPVGSRPGPRLCPSTLAVRLGVAGMLDAVYPIDDDKTVRQPKGDQPFGKRIM